MERPANRTEPNRGRTAFVQILPRAGRESLGLIGAFASAYLGAHFAGLQIGGM
jgi:hypothetical protein